MLQIQMEFANMDDVNPLRELADSSEDIDMIQEKNFSGDITLVELYISLAVNVVAFVVPVLKTLIKQKKVSSLKIDGDKIELSNVSDELIEKVLSEKLGTDDKT